MAIVKNLIIRAGADFSALEKEMAKAKKDIASWGKDIQKVGDNMTSVGKKMTAGITLPVIAAGAALGAVAVKAGQWGDELLTMSAQTGVAVGTLQELQYASNLVDVELDVMTKGLARTTKAIGAAADKGNDFIEISDGINVSIRDANGNLRRSEDVFYDTVDAIGALGNETEKEIATQKIFGKSYQDLMPLIKAGTGALKKYAEEAKKLGIIMSEDDVKKLGKFDDSMVQLNATFTAAKTKLAIALLPAMEQLMPVIQEKLIPAMVSLGESIAKVVSWFLALSPQTQENILKFVGLIAITGPLLIALGSVIGAIVEITRVFKLAKAGIMLLTGSTKTATIATEALGTAAGAASGPIGKIAGAAGTAEGSVASLGAAASLAAGCFVALGLGIAGAIEWAKRFAPELAGLRAQLDPMSTVVDQYTGALSTEANADLGNLQRQEYGYEVPEGTPTEPTVYDARWLENLWNFDTGGIVPGPLGAPSLAVVHGGEEVLTPAQRQAGGVMNHTGVITVKGVNNANELVGIAEILADNISRNDRRLPGRVSLIPI